MPTYGCRGEDAAREHTSGTVQYLRFTGNKLNQDSIFRPSHLSDSDGVVVRRIIWGRDWRNGINPSFRLPFRYGCKRIPEGKAGVTDVSKHADALRAFCPVADNRTLEMHQVEKREYHL